MLPALRIWMVVSMKGMCSLWWSRFLNFHAEAQGCSQEYIVYNTGTPNMGKGLISNVQFMIWLRQERRLRILAVNTLRQLGRKVGTIIQCLTTSLSLGSRKEEWLLLRLAIFELSTLISLTLKAKRTDQVILESWMFCIRTSRPRCCEPCFTKRGSLTSRTRRNSEA